MTVQYVIAAVCYAIAVYVFVVSARHVARHILDLPRLRLELRERHEKNEVLASVLIRKHELLGEKERIIRDSPSWRERFVPWAEVDGPTPPPWAAIDRRLGDLDTRLARETMGIEERIAAKYGRLAPLRRRALRTDIALITASWSLVVVVSVLLYLVG